MNLIKIIILCLFSYFSWADYSQCSVIDEVGAVDCGNLICFVNVNGNSKVTCYSKHEESIKAIVRKK